MLLVTAAPAIADRIVEDIKKIDRYKRQVMLDARVVSMEKGNLLNMGSQWSWPTIAAGTFTSHGIGASTSGTTTATTTSSWPYGVQIGYAPDQTFTNALMMQLNLLVENTPGGHHRQPDRGGPGWPPGGNAGHPGRVVHDASPAAPQSTTRRRSSRRSNPVRS